MEISWANVNIMLTLWLRSSTYAVIETVKCNVKTTDIKRVAPEQEA